MILLFSAAMSKGVSASNEKGTQVCFNVRSEMSEWNLGYELEWNRTEWQIVGARCDLENYGWRDTKWDDMEDCSCSSLDCIESLVGPCVREFCPICFSNPELGETQECCLPADEEQFYFGYKLVNEDGSSGERGIIGGVIPNNYQGYKSCSEPQKKRCNSTPIGRHNGVNEEMCKQICDQNDKCNYIFWNKGWYCALYEDCVQYTPSKGEGTVFAKKGLGLDCPDPCYDKLETSKCEAKEAKGKCYDVTKWNDVRFVRRHCKSTCGICVPSCKAQGNCTPL